MIPPALRHFMANLPRTVEAQAVKSLAWLSKTIDQIYGAKLTADYYDTRDGDPLQSLTDFLCEYLLMKYGLRRVAEMHLYEVVMAVKKYFHKNPKVKMFARFLDSRQDSRKSHQRRSPSGHARARHRCLAGVPLHPPAPHGTLKYSLPRDRDPCSVAGVERKWG